MNTNEDLDFDEFKRRFERLDAVTQISTAIYLTLVQARTLPRDQFGDLLLAGMKIDSFVFAMGLLNKVSELNEDKLLRPALALAAHILGENLDRLQLQFTNLMDLIETEKSQ